MPRNLSNASGLAAIFLWSTTFALARSLSRLALSAKPGARLLRLPRGYLFGCGALFVSYPVAIYLAVGLANDRAQLLEIALVNYLWPTLTILFSLPLLKKKASLWLLPGTALAVAGIVMVMTQGAQLSWLSFCEHLRANPAAYALALGAAAGWALYSNLARRWSGPDSDGAVELFVPATGLVLLALRLTATEPTHWSARALGEACALAMVTALSYALWDVAMRKGNLLLVVSCSYFTPLLSTVVSSLYLQVSPSPKLWLGCLLLILGSMITWRSVSDSEDAAGVKVRQTRQIDVA